MALLLVTGFILLVVAIVYAPQPVDWTASYSKRHSVPLGMSLVYDVVDELFPQKEVRVSNSGVADFLEDAIPLNTNLLFINDQLEMDAEDWTKVWEVATAGNHVFLAADRFSTNITDSLGFEIQQGMALPRILLNDSIGYNFANRQLKVAGHYWYGRTITNNYFLNYDTLKTTVLGYDHKGQTNFVRIRCGDGAFYINSNPIAFTNYHLINDNKSEYVFKSLSYLPVANTIWDEKYKSGAPVVASQMAFVLENRSLRMAWYLFLLGVLLFMVFQGKRRQRAIPVVEAPRNSSLDFVETIARLYFLNQNHLNIAQKRYQFFLDFLRSKYYLDTSLPESRLIEEASRKSGVPERTLAAIFRMAANMDKVSRISHEDLHQFNRQLEFFYKNCH
ncbi:hypothetical protein JCM15548_11377 [Geofilum rubicundum JCM 15548]|uniref:DUF4350 domain-containing protein n=1 Tax=Geofilum rubicundum JCM 15548 TaxID=1236989 RepID=A0A0E9LVQ6_9BACT|nr:hypothetical protein JCM15548_11377 [Geofilum rubicundum JCM 15548]